MSSNDLFNKILSNAKSAGENDSINREEGDGEKVPFDPSQLLNLNPEQLEMLSKLYGNQEADKAENNNFKSFIPEPVMCLKTKNSNSEKVFLNICKSNEINAPKDITEQELLKIIETNEPENSAFQFRVPMSLGEAHEELDNSGLACVSYDVCINSDFAKKIQESSNFMGFFVSIVIEGLENKYSIKLDRNCKLLRNKKFMGKIKEQYIRTKSKPLISEMDIKANSNLDKDPNMKDTPERGLLKETKKFQMPKYKIIREPQDGGVVEYLVAEIELPNILSANSLQLDLGEDRILLNSRSSIYHLDIFLPYNIKQEECGAQFDKKSKLLTITMAVQN